MVHPVTQTFGMTGSTLAATVNANASVDGISASVATRNDTFMAFNQELGTYTLSGSGAQVVFRPGDLNVSQSNGATTTYSITSGSVQDVFSFSPGGANGLTYSSFGVWNHQTSSGGATTMSQHMVAFGVPTDVSDMPHTGTASYTGAVTGFWASPFSDVRTVTGSSTLTADFAANRTQLTLSFQGTNTVTGAKTPVIDVTGLGSIIPNATFGGGITGGYAGEYDGRFFGPQAAEAGWSMQLTGGLSSGDKITAVAAGHR